MADNEANKVPLPKPLWARLSDRSKPPRRWWYPKIPEIPPPRPEPGETNEQHQRREKDWSDGWKARHESASVTIRRTWLIMVGYALFCLLVLGKSDVNLLAAAAEIDLPFADTPVPYAAFLLVGPFILIALTLYLHIFIGHQRYWPRVDPQGMSPSLFNFTGLLPQLLSWLIAYWLPLLVLAFFAGKALPRPEAGLLVLLAGAVMVVMVFVQIRRCRDAWRSWAIPSLVLAGLFAVTIPTGDAFCRQSLGLELSNVCRNLGLPLTRRLKLENADLKGHDLRGVSLDSAEMHEAKLSKANLSGAILWEADLSKADLAEADLRKADLWFADLTGAKLTEADLSDADLSGAKLTGATLTKAGLSGADLTDADLNGAKLNRAYLGGADLEGTDLTEADLSGADLMGATDLTCDQLTVAANWQSAQRDTDLACGALIPREEKG